MDPDANIAEQQRIANEIIVRADADETVGEAIFLRALRLSELVQALDEWIRRGGALPQRWQR